jgi:protein-tyrosine phosphatase
VIDFHTHILHDIDDGTSTLHDAVALAVAAVAHGIHTMVATPHSPPAHSSDRYHVDVVAARLTRLRQALALENVPLTVVQGTELHYRPNLAHALQTGELLPCGDHQAVLIETYSDRLPASLDDVIFELQVAGYRVVLAHPERIKPVRAEPDRLIPLIERGVLMQITAASLLGNLGENLQQCAETLLCRNMVHIIASDTHGLRKPANRHPRTLAQARDAAAALVGADAAQAMVEATPAALLAGTPLDLSMPQPVKASRRWFWPFGRG